MSAETELGLSDIEVSSAWSDDLSDASDRPRKRARRTFSHVQVPGPAFPRSAYEGWTPPVPLSTETTTLLDLKTAFDRHHASKEEQPSYTYFDLDDFSIYRPDHPRHSHELATLDRLQNRGGFNEFLFDGMLSVGDEKHFVSGVRFSIMAIDGYGDADVYTLDGQICIQSPKAEMAEVWYRFRRPSQEYKRFYDPFLWLAHFTKYFIDYLMATESVTLLQFKKLFYDWPSTRHEHRTAFSSWLRECNLKDFRTTVAANIGFLWKECWSIDDDRLGLCKHPIWGEVDPMRLTAIPERQNLEHRTIVTPFVYHCFKKMYFHEHLEPRNVTGSVILDTARQRKEDIGLTPFGTLQSRNATGFTPESLPDSAVDTTYDVTEGDVVCVPANVESGWRTSSSIWYAYVQRVRREKDRTALDVIWLYEPQDTTIGQAFYPFDNELFFSDNCECGKTAIDLDCVIRKAEVHFGVKDPSSVSGLFVRQTYRTAHDQDTYDFVSLRQSDFRCSCAQRVFKFEECRREYQIGDTVLVRQYSADIGEDALEPAQVIDFGLETQRVILRRVRRKSKDGEKYRSNELASTDDIYSMAPSWIIRKCHVRYFDHGEPLSVPYDRNGTGDCFFIRGRDSSILFGDVESLVDADSNENITDASDFIKGFPPMEQGLDTSAPAPFEKLRGMGIFCGGGNFDRGFEESGVAEFRWAIDWAEHALHSYRANTDSPDHVHFFLGSVNDYLAEAMSGSISKYVASPGDVQLINAGSPCPGFSQLQPDKQSPASLRNASMVASVVSYVDLYSPEYLVLENVVSMTHGMGAKKDQNVFAQILAALVAMGYQVQQFHMDAWSSGSSQSRSRVFIIASAPGLEPLLPPQHSHGHPNGKAVQQKSLGKSSNGKSFGVRRDDCTAFQHVSPAESTADLPYIADSQPQLCPAFPDHRTPTEESSDSRERIASVPVLPHGMGLVQAAQNGLLSGEPLEFYNKFGSLRKSKNSKTYSRVNPNALFATVTTSQKIACGVVGRTLHWSQHRPLTVMELRRAQGFLDSEVIIGSTAQQVKIIGNSVDRSVSLVLGLALRESWSRSNSLDHDETPAWQIPPHASALSHQDSTDCDGWNEDADLRLLLSQEERQNVRLDPGHGFKRIGEIIRSKVT